MRIISHASAVLLFVALAQITSAAPPILNSYKVQLPQEPEMAKLLKLELSVGGAITIPKDAFEKLAAYQASKASLDAWDQRGRELSKLHAKSVGRGWHNRPAFADEILAMLPPRPQLAAVPAETKLDLQLRVTNISDGPVAFNADFYSDLASIEFDIRGPSVYRYQRYPMVKTMEIRGGNRKTLQPGESLRIPIKRTIHGPRGAFGHWVVGKPGRYTVSIVLHQSPAFRTRHRLESNKVTFMVNQSDAEE